MASSKHIRRQLIHLRDNVSFKANVEIWIILIEQQLEFIIAEFVSWLKLAVVLSPLLHCVIGQMDETVTQIVNAVLAARCS